MNYVVFQEQVYLLYGIVYRFFALLYCDCTQQTTVHSRAVLEHVVLINIYSPFSLFLIF
jgi:hypothetical protein